MAIFSSEGSSKLGSAFGAAARDDRAERGFGTSDVLAAVVSGVLGVGISPESVRKIRDAMKKPDNSF